MNEKQYTTLCKVCDELLLAEDSKMERVAISWLHVLREHPQVLLKYQDLFSEKTNGIFNWKLLYMKIHGFFYFLKAVIGNNRPWLASRDLPENIDFLFLSHILDEEQAGNEEDFYFSTLPANLTKQGRRVVILLTNQTGLDAGQFISRWEHCDIPRVVLTGGIDAKSSFFIYRSMIREYKRLMKKWSLSNSLFQRRILSRASAEVLSSDVFSNLRLNGQIKKIIKRVSPEKIIVTHEGQAFERIVFAGAREAKPGINCIGYQHSGLFRLQHAIRRSLAPEFNPDKILTSGEIARDELEKEPGLKSIQINVLGSNRGFYSAKPIKKDNAPRNCLILPEGMISECDILFGFSLRCAKEMPGIQFIWRLHPAISFAALKEKDILYNNLPPNITLSTSSLDEDISRSQWALYRGTTAIIKAIGSGVKPVYLALPGEMTIDPLYGIETGKTVVKNSIDLAQFFDDKQEPAKEHTDSETIRQYCLKYFTPLNIDTLTT